MRACAVAYWSVVYDNHYGAACHRTSVTDVTAMWLKNDYKARCDSLSAE